MLDIQLCYPNSQFLCLQLLDTSLLMLKWETVLASTRLKARLKHQGIVIVTGAKSGPRKKANSGLSLGQELEERMKTKCRYVLSFVFDAFKCAFFGVG